MINIFFFGNCQSGAILYLLNLNKKNIIFITKYVIKLKY